MGGGSPLKGTVAYPCPNNYDQFWFGGFSKCRSEEVISFFWRSGYKVIVYRIMQVYVSDDNGLDDDDDDDNDNNDEAMLMKLWNHDT